jgi:hypothetical protein
MIVMDIVDRRVALRSTAAHVYDLLDDMCKVILDDPKHYNQSDWMITEPNSIRMILSESASADIEPPDCGTMACRAGWMVQLVDGPLARRHQYDTEDRAMAILGVTADEQASQHPFAVDVVILFSGYAIDRQRFKRGTFEYAQEGVRGTRAFMQKWAERLKRTPVDRDERLLTPPTAIFERPHGFEDVMIPSAPARKELIH